VDPREHGALLVDGDEVGDVVQPADARGGAHVEVRQIQRSSFLKMARWGRRRPLGRSFSRRAAWTAFTRPGGRAAATFALLRQQRLHVDRHLPFPERDRRVMTMTKSNSYSSQRLRLRIT
jgi:hypothetical protein